MFVKRFLTLTTALIVALILITLQFLNNTAVIAADNRPVLTHKFNQQPVSLPQLTPISTTVTAAEGGMLVSNDANGSVTVQVPPGAVTTDTVIMYEAQSLVYTGTFISLGNTFYLTATTQSGTMLLDFNKPVTVVVKHDPKPAFTGNFRLHWLQDETWVTSGIETITQTENALTSTTTHFTLFALLGEDTLNQMFLPLIMRDWPPLPDQPTLNQINNTNSGGDYTVSWSSADGALTYLLQEDDDPNFGSPTTSYEGAQTSTSISNQSPGTYYYRVQARNDWGNSKWSNIYGVVVIPPTAPTLTGIGHTVWGINTCTVQGYPGSDILFYVSYSDPNGNMRSHDGTMTVTFQPANDSSSFTFDEYDTYLDPDDNSYTSGKIEITVLCVVFGSQTSLDVSVVIKDSTGLTSNQISTNIPKPSGANRPLGEMEHGVTFKQTNSTSTNQHLKGYHLFNK